MSERLLEKMDEERGTDTTLLMTPDLADTVESMEKTISKGVRQKSQSKSAGGWTEGMEVTPGVKLVRLIADGGMGSVWVADHARLATQVAVKLVALALLEKQPSLVERLDREAAALGRLSNPNIVEIFDHGTTANGTPYIVMELLEGVTLWSLVKRHGPLSLTEVASIVEQVANGLSGAHREGIIHRDIKPQNIFLFSRNGKLGVKVIDFGIAKEMEVNAISSVTKTGTLLGTPHFMSPEQLLKPKTIDARTDLWSLGVLTYHALSRQFPFNGDTLAQLFGCITKSSYAPVSTHCPHLPPSIDAWMAKSLAEEPKDRFRTARELAVALKRVVADLDEEAANHRAEAPAVPDDEDEDKPDTKPFGSQPAPPQPRAEHSSAPPRPSHPSRAPQPSHPSSPPDGSGSDKKLLPYPFALMEEGDDDASQTEVASEGLAVEEDGEERLRRILMIAALVAIAAIVVAIVSR